jgi:hypothetical protein
MSIAAISIGDASFAEEVKRRGAKLMRSAPAASRPADMIFYGANHRDALVRLAALSKMIQQNGAIWVVRPKGRAEITEAETMAAGKRAGLVDVKVVSFSETHTAEKFMIPVARRGGCAWGHSIGTLNRDTQSGHSTLSVPALGTKAASD